MEVTPSILWFSIVNSIVNLILLPTVLFRFYKLVDICHKHFWGIMLQVHLCCFLIVLTTGVMAFATYLDVLTNATALTVLRVANMVATLASNAYQVFVLFTFVERCFATVYRNRYEQNKHYGLLACAVSIGWIYGVWSVLSWNVIRIDTAIIGNVSIAIDVTCIVCTAILWKMNVRLKTVERHSSGLVLTRRYQVHENVRMTAYAMPIMFIVTSGLMIYAIFSYSMLPWFGMETHPSQPLVYFAGINIHLTIYYVFDWGKAWLWPIFQHLQLLLHLKPKCRHAERPSNLAAVVPMENHADYYFNNLRQAWS